jgi:twitching motility protein PilT
MTSEIIDALLQGMAESHADVSDLIFTTGKPPLVESGGKLLDFPVDTPGAVLDSRHIEQIATHIINGNERLQRDFDTLGACDCSYSIGEQGRFRVNVFKQKGRHAIVMRRLQVEIPTLAQLGLPPIFKQISRETSGMVFVTGATGSGKTTTLAAMMNEINETQPSHVVTLEDPIEFCHPHKQAAFNQREMGTDFSDFASGLRSALRQAPKIILVGEIRDRETMEIALTASETGHVVFSTLHTISAGQTVNRILGMFSREEEQQVRQRLADTLRYIVTQKLVPRSGGGRLLVTEIMGSSLRTKESLLYGEGENRTFDQIIEAGETYGWHSFDQSLLKAYEAGLISDDTVLIFSTHKDKMRREIDLIKKIRNQSFDSASGLRLEPAPEPLPVEVPAVAN